MTLQTLQNEIVKEFWIFWGISPKGSLKYKKGKDIEKFISSSTKRAWEEGRKDIFNNLPKVIEPPKAVELFKEKRLVFLSGQMNMLMRLNDLNLSLTEEKK